MSNIPDGMNLQRASVSDQKTFFQTHLLGLGLSCVTNAICSDKNSISPVHKWLLKEVKMPEIQKKSRSVASKSLFIAEMCVKNSGLRIAIQHNISLVIKVLDILCMTLISQ